jgi:predicted enzyme related to lactoylglutathione lyase
LIAAGVAVRYASREAAVQLLVNIDVDDLETAIRFYTEAFALSVGRKLGTDVVELLGAGAPIYLLARASGTEPHSRAHAARSYERHWTPVHLDIAVDDIDAARARALRAGATAEGAIETHVWGKIARLSDPFGHGFCLLQFTGRGYDALVTPD